MHPGCLTSACFVDGLVAYILHCSGLDLPIHVEWRFELANRYSGDAVRTALAKCHEASKVVGTYGIRLAAFPGESGEDLDVLPSDGIRSFCTPSRACFGVGSAEYQGQRGNSWGWRRCFHCLCTTLHRSQHQSPTTWGTTTTTALSGCSQVIDQAQRCASTSAHASWSLPRFALQRGSCQDGLWKAFWSGRKERWHIRNFPGAEEATGDGCRTSRIAVSEKDAEIRDDKSIQACTKAIKSGWWPLIFIWSPSHRYNSLFPLPSNDGSQMISVERALRTESPKNGFFVCWFAVLLRGGSLTKQILGFLSDA